jgi:hypothetical protein
METPLVLKNSHSPAAYDISLKIGHEKANFTGSISISMTRSSKSDNTGNFEFLLNSSELVLMNAIFKTDDKEYKAKVTYEKARELVKLSVEGSDLYAQNNVTLNINYIGKINTIKTFRDITKGLFKTNYLDDRSNTATNYILATHCQTSFARCIFPCVDEPASKVIFSLTIETLASFKVISNTSAESKIVDESKNLQTIKFRKTPLMTPSIFGFVLGDLDFIESTVQLEQGLVPIRLFTAIGSVSDAAYALDVASKILPSVESLFEHPYPLDKLDIVSLPFLSDGAMENFGLITIQSGHILLQSLSNKNATHTVRQLIAHEIIHHWLGNNVSFDEWAHLWLNEAFSTWFANYVLSQLDLDPNDKDIWLKQTDEDLESILQEDASLHSTPVVSSLGNAVKNTHDAFQVSSYQKGMHFLRMLANTFESTTFNDQLDRFTKALAKFFKAYDFKLIKPADLWKALHDDSPLDLLAFSHSWLRLPGFPVVSVSLNEDSKIVIEQNRFLETSSPEAESLENAPYHVPLAIKLIDGSIVNKILNDRRMILEEIKPEEFVKLNTNRTGFYRITYDNIEIIYNLVKNFEKLSTMDLIGIFHDLNQIIGHDHLHSDIAIVTLVKLSDKVMTAPELQFKVLRIALTNLVTVENSFKLLANEESYSRFSEWLIKTNAKLFERLDWESDYAQYSSDELECRAMILSIGLSTSEVKKVGEKLFKKLLHGPSHSVPAHLLNVSMAIVALNANQNTWKKILELVKSPGATVSHIFGGSAADIQHGAISSIGFTKDPILVKRVLNFVTTNIDSNMIETALVGLQFNNEMNKKVLWDWFKLNYDQWVLKSCRTGSQLSGNMRKTLKGITMIVLAGMTRHDDKRAVEAFVASKLAKLPEHELQETVELFMGSQRQKVNIATSNVALVRYL